MDSISIREELKEVESAASNWIDQMKKHFIDRDHNEIDFKGMEETPMRVSKAWKYLLSGYNKNPKEILSKRFIGANYKQMVILKDIEMYSVCEHHLLPFVGKCSIAYIPNKEVVGLSKLARLVECFARRFQIQERLTDQIADALVEHLECLGVGVVIESKHFCMCARGVAKQNSTMITSAIRGSFEDGATRKEFFDLVK